MKNSLQTTIIAALFFIVFSVNGIAQTLIDTIPLPSQNEYTYTWGLTRLSDGFLYLGSDFTGSILKMDEAGNTIKTIKTAFDFNHGLAWVNNQFWLAQDYQTQGVALYAVNQDGKTTDTLKLPNVIEGKPSGVGDLDADGNGLWFTIYYPDFDVYPYNHAYRIDLATEKITDTIPLYGKQVYGIATKGDTIFYVTDNLDDDPERIWAYSRTKKDTLFTWPLADPDGDQRPQGLHYDGQYLWLIADRVGPSAYAYKTLYKYAINATPAHPVAQIPPDTLCFKPVQLPLDVLGEIKTIAITNAGTADLILNNLNIVSYAFLFDNWANEPITIPPGQTYNLQVRFYPPGNAVFDASLSLQTNAGNYKVWLCAEAFTTGIANQYSSVNNMEPVQGVVLQNPVNVARGQNIALKLLIADKYGQNNTNSSFTLPIAVSNAQGQLIQKYEVANPKNNDIIQLPNQNLNAGIYYIQAGGKYGNTVKVAVQ